MQNTKIEWCDASWNPVTGCLNGCEYCYANRIACRFGGMMPDRKCHVLDEVNKDVFGRADPYPWGFAPTLHRYRMDIPKHWKKPKTIFVCSMADLFGDWVPDEWIREVFKACEDAPQHTYLFLTKNPDRYVRLKKNGELPDRKNMWYGTTAPTPDTEFFVAKEYNVFVSVEPVLEPFCGGYGGLMFADWVIVGAETGNRKGKVVPEKNWIDSISAKCRCIPVFMKNSLAPIIGGENMRREFPWGDGKDEKGGRDNAGN